MMVLLMALLAQTLAQTVPADQDRLTFGELRRAALEARLHDEPVAAERALVQASPLAAKLYGDTSLELAALLSDLSGVKRALGNLTDAVLVLESALRMRELHPDAPTVDYVSDLLRLAGLRAELDEPAAARELWTNAKVACEKSLRPDSPPCLAALDVLAGSLRDQSEYAEAEPLYVRLLALRQAAFGKDSAELISTLDSLAYVRFGLKRYDDAQTVYERLLALWESSAGPDHPMVALTLDKMAELFAAKDRYAEAEPLSARSTAIRARAFIDSLARYGRIFEAQAKSEEACHTDGDR